MLVSMFEKVNERTTVVKVIPPTVQAEVVVIVVVTGPCIGFVAGAFPGTRIPSAAMVTHAMTRILIVSCLFKSVPSCLFSVFDRLDVRLEGLTQVPPELILEESRVWAEG